MLYQIFSMALDRESGLPRDPMEVRVEIIDTATNALFRYIPTSGEREFAETYEAFWNDIGSSVDLIRVVGVKPHTHAAFGPGDVYWLRVDPDPRESRINYSGETHEQKVARLRVANEHRMTRENACVDCGAPGQAAAHRDYTCDLCFTARKRSEVAS